MRCDAGLWGRRSCRAGRRSGMSGVGSSWYAVVRTSRDEIGCHGPSSANPRHTSPRSWPWTLAVPRTIAPRLMLAVVLLAFVLGPVVAGFAPLGGDPVLMYQPIKTELARALSAGRLPFWSDRIGLGAPLIAESHIAAFYPPNWLLYRLWDVATAYQLTMWIHMLAILAATYAYARELGIGRAGSTLASVSFTLCGFQAVHVVHEPFYHVMPYLPLCLLLADRYASTGRLVWLAWLALAWGMQITLGHFQIQMWTAGLVLATGGWRALTATGVARRPTARILGLAAGLCWGAAVAWVQLRLTWELTGAAGFSRPSHLLANFLFPPAHWRSSRCRRCSSPAPGKGAPTGTSTGRSPARRARMRASSLWSSHSWARSAHRGPAAWRSGA